MAQAGSGARTASLAHDSIVTDPRVIIYDWSPPQRLYGKHNCAGLLASLV